MSDNDDVVIPKTAEQWAMLCSIKIAEDHGEGGPVYIAQMLGRCVFDGNESGIARAYDELMRPPGGLN